jgi:hypothetical protein
VYWTQRSQRRLYAVDLSPGVDQSDSLRTDGGATSCIVSSVIRPSGVQTDLQASGGDDLAFLESELRVTGHDEYEEDGRSRLATAMGIFCGSSTPGQGHVTAGLEPGTMAGTASWKVKGGEGQFAAVRGFITSTFTISDSGERSDFHCGLIFLPE